MNNKEYTYDIDKYTIGVDTNGEDGIGMTVAKIENGELHFLGNCYGENARCIDLLIKENQELKKKYENAVADYETTMAKKEQLKKQLDDANEKILLLQASEPMLNYKKALEESQQKEFVDWLENYIERLSPPNSYNNDSESLVLNIVLQKYREIMEGPYDETN